MNRELKTSRSNNSSERLSALVADGESQFVTNREMFWLADSTPAYFRRIKEPLEGALRLLTNPIIFGGVCFWVWISHSSHSVDVCGVD
jgi:hypothetical protein